MSEEPLHPAEQRRIDAERALAEMASRPAVGHPAFTGAEFKPAPDGLPETHEPPRPVPMLPTTELDGTGLENPDYDPQKYPVHIESRPVDETLGASPSKLSGYGESTQE